MGLELADEESNSGGGIAARVAALEERGRGDDERLGALLRELGQVREQLADVSALLNDVYARQRETQAVVVAISRGIGVSVPPTARELDKLEQKVGVRVRTRAEWVRLVAGLATLSGGMGALAYQLAEWLGR